MRGVLLLVGACAGAPDALCINEVMASNQGAVWHEDTTPDWIELHNPGHEAVDLQGWFVSDDVDTPAKHPLPSLTVAPKGYQLLWANGGSGPEELPFRLSARGEWVVLTSPEGVQDRLGFPTMASDFAWARDAGCCQGPACWTATWLVTPGAENAP